MSQSTLQLDYLSSDDIALQPASWWNSVLGIVGFERAPQIELAQVPVAASMTPRLGAADLCEVWRSAGGEGRTLSDASLRHGRIHYRHCGEFLFGSMAIDEDPTQGSASAALLQATTTAYREIFAVLEETQHRHLIRVWLFVIGAAARWARFRRPAPSVRPPAVRSASTSLRRAARRA